MMISISNQHLENPFKPDLGLWLAANFGRPQSPRIGARVYLGTFTALH